MKHTPLAPETELAAFLRSAKEKMFVFEEEYEALYRKQLVEARGQRREMLERDLSATKKMLEVAYPVMGSLASVVLEYEMVSLSGV